MQALSARTAIAAPVAKLNARAPARKVRPRTDRNPRREGRSLPETREITVLTWREETLTIDPVPAPCCCAQVAMRAAVTPTAGIPIHIEYCEK